VGIIIVILAIIIITFNIIIIVTTTIISMIITITIISHQFSLDHTLRCDPLLIIITARIGAEADVSSFLVERYRLLPRLLWQAQPTVLRPSSGATQLHLPRREGGGGLREGGGSGAGLPGKDPGATDTCLRDCCAGGTLPDCQ
jgi:hypothetical protein